MERQVTIPLEVALAGMPGLKYTQTQSMFELCHIRNQFEYGVDQPAARQEILNRLQMAQLPAGITPAISPQSPTGEIFRYVLTNPKDAAGRDIYNLNDLKSLQDFTLERSFRRLPGVADVCSFGGTVKRYEIHPDPARMQRYGITLQQIKDAVSASNPNAGGEYVIEGDTAHVVRFLGLIGYGQDPIETAMGMKDPVAARDYLRSEEERRLREIRQIVLTATNNVPVRVDDVVEGGPLHEGDAVDRQGVVVGWQTRLGHVERSYPLLDAQGKEVLDAQGQRVWHDDDDVVQCICLLRKGDQSLPVLAEVKALVKQLNESPGRMLPGVKITPYYDRTDLIHVTTDTVRENLLAGMGLVTLVLFMFLTNVRGALIVAINIPLALLFAFAVLFLRGKSANLLSIGAVDFGIIVDSSVIIVENIYRHLSSRPERRSAHRPANHPRFQRDPALPVLLDGDHDLRLPAAVHDVRPGRADFRTDGRDLRLRPGRGVVVGAGPFPRALHVFSQEPQAHARQLPGAGLANELLAAVAALHGPSLADPGLFRHGGGRHRGGAAVPGRRVHAGVGGREHLGPGAIPLELLAGGSLRIVAKGP